MKSGSERDGEKVCVCATEMENSFIKTWMVHCSKKKGTKMHP
jgi:hypothetical protein